MTGPEAERCDVCGSANLTWRKCKQLCLDCGSINRSCADLADGAPPADPSPRLP